MYIGVCEITLHLPASASLKDKRQVLRSVLARLRNQFEIAAAEVEYQDTWQRAALGLACVSNDAGHAEEVVRAATRYVEESRPDVEITDIQFEVLAFPA